MRLTASKFAKLADTTVRTLRHYRQLGILVPSQKNEELYRNVKPYESLIPKHTMDFLTELVKGVVFLMNVAMTSRVVFVVIKIL